MPLPWSSRRKLERTKEKLEAELAELRAEIATKKTEIKAMEKELYWGEVSLSEMKGERKAFIKAQSRIRVVKKKLRGIEMRLAARGVTDMVEEPSSRAKDDPESQ